MASMNGKDLLLFIKHPTYTDDDWKVAVCSNQHTLDEKKNESTNINKCGTETIVGTDDNQISLDLTFLKGTPAPTEISAKTLRTMYRAGVEFEWRIADDIVSAIDIDDEGSAVMTAISTTAPAEGFVNVAITMKVNGPIVSNV